MSVIIKNVIPGSPADKAGYKPGTELISINGTHINDVLDYMFCADEDFGLEFDTFLMDDKRSCGNNCIFCFIDQLPKGMRPALYFKDDDSRLSFLQGNYITLTNLTEHDVNRIIQMKTAVNISVHTTNPALREHMMNNPKAGDSLKTLYRFAEAGISMNCQLVLCPNINDGDELVRTLTDLTALNERNNYPIESIACVPVGLTKHRKNLPYIHPFNKKTAAAVIETAGKFDKVYAADELYITANIAMPDYDFYGMFPQYENGVGMWAYMKHGFIQARNKSSLKDFIARKSIITGTAAFPLISELVKDYKDVTVFPIRNDFFGESVNVSGLLTGKDIIAQLLPRKSELGEQLLIGANTLNADGLFLDGVTPGEIETALGVSVNIVEPDGEALFYALES